MTLITREALVGLHLDQLSAILSSDHPGPGGAVQASIILRVLMDRGLLGRVGRDHGLVLKVLTPEVKADVIGQSLFFACGGHRCGERLVPPLWVFREPGPKSPHRPQFESLVAESRQDCGTKEVKLGKFWNQPSLGAFGATIDREKVVRFVANRCGGAHHSASEENFEEVEKLISDVGRAFQLDGNGLSIAFSEVLGTAWYLLASPSVRDLRRRLAHEGAVLPDPGVPGEIPEGVEQPRNNAG